MKVIPKIRAPKGYRFVVVEKDGGYDEPVIKLYHGTEQIGKISLHKTYATPKGYSTHSNLNESYRGKGLGTLMYARAIQYCLENGYRVQSSGGSSGYAQRVWNGQGLKKYFRIRMNPNLHASCPTWCAYPKYTKNK